MKKIFLLGIIVFAFQSVFAKQDNELVLCKNKKALVDILIDKLDTNSIHSAKIIQEYFEKISGAHFEIVEKPQQKPVLEYRYYKNPYQLLEAVGCRYFTADCVFIPKLDEIKISPDKILNDKPSFNYREIFYAEAFKGDYSKWNSVVNSKDEKRSEWGLWVHTLPKLVPAAKYFQPHPEYFSLKNGVRIKDQLCLSNPAVLELCIDSLQAQINRNPTAKYWSVSQDDNFGYCECADCKRTDSIEQSHSGSMIKFVNAVAKHFPDKIISTLAYQYTRKAPAHIKPESNVSIMLCTIECDRSKPLAVDTSKGSFVDDLKSWGALTNNIIVWDYVINFHHYLMPFPNWQVLQPNLQLFKKCGVQMIFEQGAGNDEKIEMEELRCYLLSKLLWNVNANVDELMNDFLKIYYGEKAALFIKRYIQLQTKYLNEGHHELSIYEPPFMHASGFLSPKHLQEYFTEIDSAISITKADSVFYPRLIRIKTNLQYADLDVAKSLVFTNDWCFEKNKNNQWQIKQDKLNEFNNLIASLKKVGPTYLHERQGTIDAYEKFNRDYFFNGIKNHKAVDAKISFVKPYAKQYSANGDNSLIDGVTGTMDYQMLWQGWQGDDVEGLIDLGKIDSVQQINFRFLDNNEAWIMAPQKVEVEFSEDGKNYFGKNEMNNSNSSQKINPQIVGLNCKSVSKIQARFIHFKINAQGKMPKWRGVSGNSWTFIDEIEVN